MAKPKITQATLLSPEQQQLMSLIVEGLTKGEGALKDIFGGFDKESFSEGVEKPALKNFQENILPMLNEKFIAGNQVGGSGMMRAQNKAGVDLQSELAKLMYGAQQEAGKNKMVGLQALLGKQPFENIVQQPSQDQSGSFWSKILPALGTAGGAVAGGFFGGVPGATAGANAGNQVGKAIAG